MSHSFGSSLFNSFNLRIKDFQPPSEPSREEFFLFHDVPGDGNCFWHCCTMHDWVKGNNGLEFRLSLEKMADDAKVHDKNIDRIFEAFKPPTMNWEAWKVHISNDGEYAEEIDIMLTAYLCNVDIVIVRNLLDGSVCSSRDALDSICEIKLRDGAPQAFLLHHIGQEPLKLERDYRSLNHYGNLFIVTTKPDDYVERTVPDTVFDLRRELCNTSSSHYRRVANMSIEIFVPRVLTNALGGTICRETAIADLKSNGYETYRDIFDLAGKLFDENKAEADVRLEIVKRIMDLTSVRDCLATRILSEAINELEYEFNEDRSEVDAHKTTVQDVMMVGGSGGSNGSKVYSGLDGDDGPPSKRTRNSFELLFSDEEEGVDDMMDHDAYLDDDIGDDDEDGPPSKRTRSSRGRDTIPIDAGSTKGKRTRGSQKGSANNSNNKKKKNKTLNPLPTDEMFESMEEIRSKNRATMNKIPSSREPLTAEQQGKLESLKNELVELASNKLRRPKKDGERSYSDYANPLSDLLLELVQAMEERRVQPEEVHLLVLWMGLCGNGERTEIDGTADSTCYSQALREFEAAFPGVFDENTFVKGWNVRWRNCVKTTYGNCCELHDSEVEDFVEVFHRILLIVEILFKGSIVYLIGAGGGEGDRVLKTLKRRYPPATYTDITVVTTFDIKVHFSSTVWPYAVSYPTLDEQRISRTNGILDLAFRVCQFDTSSKSIKEVFGDALKYLCDSDVLKYVQRDAYIGNQLEEMKKLHRSGRYIGYMKAVARHAGMHGRDDWETVTPEQIRDFRKHNGELGYEAAVASFVGKDLAAGDKINKDDKTKFGRNGYMHGVASFVGKDLAAGDVVSKADKTKFGRNGFVHCVAKHCGKDLAAGDVVSKDDETKYSQKMNSDMHKIREKVKSGNGSAKERKSVANQMASLREINRKKQAKNWEALGLQHSKTPFYMKCTNEMCPMHNVVVESACITSDGVLVTDRCRVRVSKFGERRKTCNRPRQFCDSKGEPLAEEPPSITKTSLQTKSQRNRKKGRR